MSCPRRSCAAGLSIRVSCRCLTPHLFCVSYRFQVLAATELPQSSDPLAYSIQVDASSFPDSPPDYYAAATAFDDFHEGMLDMVEVVRHMGRTLQQCGSRSPETLTGALFADQYCHDNWDSMSAAVEGLWSTLWSHDRSGFGGTASGGAGVGFGIQLLCDGEVILSLGGGGGWGKAVQAEPGTHATTWSGGTGGGGGVQAYKSGTMWSTVGGGGGNTMDSRSPSPQCTSSPDAVVKGTESCELWWEHVRNSCPSGSITAVGGGGGGGGFTVDGLGSDGGSETFGGSWAFKFGDTARGGEPAANSGGVIGSRMLQCVNSCKGAGAGFNRCFCPCGKHAMEALGEPWASTMTCEAGE